MAIISMPGFWVALMLQILFSSKLHWLPLTGQFDTVVQLMAPVHRVTGLPMLDCLVTGNWTALGNLIWHSVLPLSALVSYNLGLTSRMTRSILLEVLNEDYIRASRAYGSTWTTPRS